MYLNVLKKAWHYALNSRRLFVMVFATQFVSMCFALAKPIFEGNFFNTLQIGGSDIWKNAIFWLSLLLLVHFIHVTLWHYSHYLADKVSFDIRKNSTRRYYDIYTKLPMDWHIDHHSGETMGRINQAVEGISKFPGHQPKTLRFVMNFFGPVILLCLYSWQIALIAFAAYFTMLWGMMKMDVKKARFIKEKNTREQEFNRTLLDGLTNIKTIITLKIAGKIQTAIANAIEKIKIPFLKIADLNRGKWSIFDFGNFLIINLIILFYAWQQYRQNNYIMIGSVFAVYQYLRNLQNVMVDYGAEYQELLQMKVMSEEINPLLEEYERISSEAKPLKSFKNISLSNLNFRYKNCQNAGLYSIDMNIAVGQKIAFIGESGSGKSTMLGILAGLFKDVGGDVNVDGRKSSLNAVASLAVLLPQEPEIFENTILYNIGMDVPHSDKEINKALALSRFDEVLAKLGGSLQSEAKEKGLNISGGEKQRLALARGILAMKSSKLILLDEPTSSIDVNNENLIYDALFAEFRNQTVISAVHHLNLVDKFDYIYVFANGCIAEHGTPDALKKQKGLFAEMLKKITLKPEK